MSDYVVPGQNLVNTMVDEVIQTTLPALILEISGYTKDSIKLPDDLRGAWSILYFYPRDNTPGCTTQACSYRDAMEEFSTRRVNVFGISTDSVNSHNNFREKYNLNFPLIADDDGKLATALKAEGNIVNKILKSAARDTFLVDPECKIVCVWRKVSPKSTVAEVYEEITARIK